MEKVVARSTYNRKAHYDYYIFHTVHRSSQMFLLIFVLIFVFIFAIINTINAEDLFNILFSWGLFIFTLVFTPVLVLGRMRKLINEESKKREGTMETIEATKAKVTRKNDLLEGKDIFGWHQIDSVYETKEYIYIYVNKDQGFILIKSDITDGDASTFRKLAKNNMKPNKRGKVKYITKFKEKRK